MSTNVIWQVSELLTKYENDVGLGVELPDLRTDANADALTPCSIAVLHRVAPSFTMTSVFAAAATHAIQRVPRLACLCARCACVCDCTLWLTGRHLARRPFATKWPYHTQTAYELQSEYGHQHRHNLNSTNVSSPHSQEAVLNHE